MGTCNGNKPPSYVVADSVSPDSLSFSGLVSIQDRQSKSPPSLPLNQSNHHGQTTNQSPEFEFATTRPTPHSAANSVKTKPADLRISIEQLQPQATAIFQSNLNQSSVTDHHLHHHIPSLSSLLSAHGNGKRVSSGNSRKFDGVDQRGRKPRNSKSFFEYLVSPCRECVAFEPKVKSH